MIFLPFGDEPNAREVPVMNYAIIAANVLVYVLISMPLMGSPIDPRDPAAQEYINYLFTHFSGFSLEQVHQTVSAYQVFTFHYGFRPADPSFFTLFSSMFLHGGFWHLAGNMLFLWIYGDNVEHRLGAWSYLFIYLLCGAVATLTFSSFAWGSETPLVGASGAIFGALGLYFIWFPRNQVKVFVWVFFFLNVYRIPARLLIGFYLIWNNLIPVVAGIESSTAFAAHIGGALAGMWIAWIFDRRGESPGLLGSVVRALDRRRTIQREAGVSFTPVGQSAFSRFGASPASPSGPAGFAQAISRGNSELAARILAGLTSGERAQLNDSDVMRLADYYTDSGAYDRALMILQRFIGDFQGTDRASRAHLRAGLIYLHFKKQGVTAAQHFHSVLDMNPSFEMEQVVRNSLAQIES